MIIKDYLRNYLLKDKIYDRIYSWAILRQVRHRDRPTCIYTESTNMCNSRCVFCPRNLMKREEGYMDFSLYKEVIGKCEQLSIPQVRLHNFGEPLLDKNICKKVRYAKNSGIKIVGLFTNASLLDEKLSKELIEAGIDYVSFSLDSDTKENYEKLRRGLNFDTVVNNIEYFLKIGKKVYTQLIFAGIEKDKKEIKRFLKRWSNLVNKIYTINTHSWAGHIPFARDNEGRRWPCPIPWNSLFVLWNGDVTFCCEDFDGQEILGNIENNSIEEIWNSKRYKYIREKHLKREYESIPICNNCAITNGEIRLWWLRGYNRFL